MNRRKIAIGTAAGVFLLIPVVHVALLSLLSAEFRDTLARFAENLGAALGLLARSTNLLVFVWVIELAVFIYIGVRLFFLKNVTGLVPVAAASLAFLVIIVLSIFVYPGRDYTWHVLALLFTTLTLAAYGVIALTSVRKFPFFLARYKWLKPWFRHRCHIDITLSRKGNMCPAKLVDLSRRGVHVLAEAPFAVDEEYNVKFKLDKDTIQFTVKVVRTEQEPGSKTRGFGGRIIGVKPAAAKRLTGFLRVNDDIQIYRSRLKLSNAALTIFSDEGLLEYGVYDLDARGAFIVTNDKWKVRDAVHGILTLDGFQCEIAGTIARLNNVKDFSRPRGFSLVFDKPLDFCKKLLKK